MNEQKNSVPEQSEPEQVTNAQEQQTAAEQESQTSEQDTTEQIDYKSELEKANSRIAELELECDKHTVGKEWLIADGYENEVIGKAREMIHHGFAENITQAVGMLKETMPEIITANRMPKFSFSTSGGRQFSNTEKSDFTTGLTSSKPVSGVGDKIREW